MNNTTNIKVPKKYQHMLDTIEFEPAEGGYWAYAKEGYEFGCMTAHTAHEYNQKDMLDAIRTLRECECHECQQEDNSHSEENEEGDNEPIETAVEEKEVDDQSTDIFQKYNPNPNNNQVGDCVVRALCKATGKTWDSIYKELAQLGFTLKTMPNDYQAWHECLRQHGFERQGVSIKKGDSRPKVRELAQQLGQGVYVMRVSGHLVTAKDGQYFDSFDSGNKAVYSYWKIAE